MQNNMICFILSKPSRYHVGFEEFKKVEFLPVKLMVEQLKLMFNIINGVAPTYLGSQILMVHTQHAHATMATARCHVLTVGQEIIYFVQELIYGITSHLTLTCQEQKGILNKKLGFTCGINKNQTLLIHLSHI